MNAYWKKQALNYALPKNIIVLCLSNVGFNDKHQVYSPQINNHLFLLIYNQKETKGWLAKKVGLHLKLNDDVVIKSIGLKCHWGCSEGISDHIQHQCCRHLTTSSLRTTYHSRLIRIYEECGSWQGVRLWCDSTIPRSTFCSRGVCHLRPWCKVCLDRLVDIE